MVRFLVPIKFFSGPKTSVTIRLRTSQQMDHFLVPDHAVPVRKLFHTNIAASFGHQLLLKGNCEVGRGEVMVVVGGIVCGIGSRAFHAGGGEGK